MKIREESFERLKTACLSVLAANNLSLTDVTSTRQAWGVFHATKSYWLYEHFNDAHIETALKRIFPHI